jgi:hypothetical protein
MLTNDNGQSACSAETVGSATFRLVKTIIALQMQALILINLQRFGLAPSGLLCSRMAHLGKEEFGLAVRHQAYPHCRCRYPHHG